MTQRLAFPALLLLLLFAAFFQLGCDSAPNPIAPDNSSLSISANPSRIGLTGESSLITVIGFRPDGNPLSTGTQLSVSTTVGSLRLTNNINGPVANIVQVESNGRARFFLFGDGRQGTAAVTAALTLSGGGTAGGAGSGSGGDGDGGGGGGTSSTSTSATISVQIGDDASTQPTVTVTANPPAIALNEASTITVTAKNADQSPLAGETAIVRTSLGALTFDNGNVTDSNGVVTLTLTSSQSGQAEVTATVGSSAEAMATIEIGTTRKPVVTLNANPSTIDVGEQSTITITARDENGNLLQGTDTAFVDADLGTLQGVSGGGTTTLTDGRGEVIFIAGDVADTGSVSAFVDNSDVASVDIEIRDEPAAITLTSDPASVSKGGADDTVTLRATVTNITGRPVNGESVTFSAEDGISFTCAPSTCVQATEASGGVNGIATITMTFVDSSLPDAGNTFRVFARVRGVAEPAEFTVTVN